MASPFFFEATQYWSEGDERAHFEWLERIPSIKSIRGELHRVFLFIETETITSEDFRELEAVYRRYGGDLTQLAALKEQTAT